MLFLENSEETINTLEESTSGSQMDTSTGREPGEKTPDKFENIQQTDPNYLLDKTITLPLPQNMMADLLNFKTNQLSDLPQIPVVYLATDSTENALKSSELSTYSEGKVTVPSVNSNTTQTGAVSRMVTKVDPRLTTRLNSVQNNDIPSSVTSNILGYDPVTSVEEPIVKKNIYDYLPHSPNSLFELRNAKDRATYEQETKMDEDQPPTDKANDVPFQTPKKFSKNF